MIKDNIEYQEHYVLFIQWKPVETVTNGPGRFLTDVSTDFTVALINNCCVTSIRNSAMAEYFNQFTELKLP